MLTIARNLTVSRKPAGSTIPAHVTTLGVSWLNNQFKAVAVHRGKIEGSWEQPEAAEGEVNFQGLLREAIQKTGFRGQTVSLVLAQPRLAISIRTVEGYRLRLMRKLEIHTLAGLIRFAIRTGLISLDRSDREPQ
jgi:hypothetical protein